MRALGGGLQFAGRGLGVAWAPRGGVGPPVCSPSPRRLPQEHKAEVKASIKARFQAGQGRGTAGARTMTRGTQHGSSEHRRGDVPTSRGKTRHTEPGPHPQLAGCPSVHLSTCPSEQLGACGLGLCSLWESWLCQATSLQQVPERQGVGAAGWRGPRPGAQASLSVSGPQGPAQKESEWGRPGDNLRGKGGLRAPRPPSSQEQDHQRAGPAAPWCPVSRCRQTAEDEGWAAEVWLSSPRRLRQAWASSPGAEKLGGVAAGVVVPMALSDGGQLVFTPRFRMWSHPRRTLS